MKRSAHSMLEGGDGQISIRVAAAADAPAPLLAVDRFTLHVASQCARGLPPPGADVWDVSQLRIDGAPVSREVVVAWLNVVHQWFQGQPYEQAEPPLQATASGLAQLLAFADAVDSSRGVLAACLSQLEHLTFSVALDGRRLELQLGVIPHQWVDGDLCAMTPDYRPQEGPLLPCDEGERAAVTQQVTGQVEELLYLAHRLRLPRLIDAMHRCVKLNTTWPDHSLLRRDRALAAVITPRVLEEAAGPGRPGQLAFVNSLLMGQCRLVTEEDRELYAPSEHTAPWHGLQQVFQWACSDQPSRPITYKAMLAQPFMGNGSSGQQVEVRLDLFRESTVTVNGLIYPVQLLVGAPVTEDEFEKLRAGGGADGAAAAAAAQ